MKKANSFFTAITTLAKSSDRFANANFAISEEFFVRICFGNFETNEINFVSNFYKEGQDSLEFFEFLCYIQSFLDQGLDFSLSGEGDGEGCFKNFSDYNKSRLNKQDKELLQVFKLFLKTIFENSKYL
jgi:hypothetical protein